MTVQTPSNVVRKRLSAWSVLAMVLAIGLGPFVTAAAIPAGLWALRDIARNGRTGRPLAITAIVIGVVVTPITTIGAIWWNNHVRAPLMSGPAAVLAIGQRGDLEGFVRQTASRSSPEEAGQFLRELTRDLGIIRSTRPSEAGATNATPEGEESLPGWWIWVPYEAMFEGGATHIRARFLLSDPERGWVNEFDRFDVTLLDGRSLRWPSSEDDS